MLGNTKIWAHKHVLAAESEVFEEMFFGEITENEISKIEIVDVDFEIFGEFIKYFYSGKVNNLDNIVERMILVAEEYKVPKLKTLCENRLVKKINMENVGDYIYIADKMFCPLLELRALEFLEKHVSLFSDDCA